MVCTQSVRVRVVPPQNLSGRFDEHIKLYAEAGEVVACVSDGSVNKDWFLATYSGRTSGTYVDLLALSLELTPVFCFSGKILRGMTQPINKMVYKDWRGRPLGKYDLGEKNVPIVNLMVVDTQDGVSRRVALAETYLKIWVKAERKFGTFVIV